MMIARRCCIACDRMCNIDGRSLEPIIDVAASIGWKACLLPPTSAEQQTTTRMENE